MPEIIVGCALSDVNRADLPRGLRVPERLADYVKRMSDRVGGPKVSLQLQPEDVWTTPVVFPDQFTSREQNRWWKTFHANARLQLLFAAPNMLVGVHQPLQRIDVLSSNFFKKYESIEETKAAMDFAEFIGADYFVFHLAQVDKWTWERRDQIAKALKIFQVFATYYHTKQMNFTPCIELVEFPRFPSNGGELYQLMDECKQILPETRIAFDVSHLYSSFRRIRSTGHLPDASVTFAQVLQFALEQNWRDVYLYQLGGSWESEHHAVPGLHPQEDPRRFPVKLRESAMTYDEMGELDLNATLELITEYSTRKNRDLHLVLEIFDRDIDQSLETARVIRADLEQRAVEPSHVGAIVRVENRSPAKKRGTAQRSNKKTNTASRRQAGRKK
jgi:sugar phosphate isomerase/epimerase